ncbi:MAG: hypothetical protein UU32_C0004G0008 [Candidatus Woesebacteria bacterium GW2011_GWB1_41_10]|uniref:Transcriptional regulator n=1 Tax=Candidatus Woesebacteria bacterium GW2011_GWB1_41_10 TaxID=1618577 RepID=A0A0G0UFH5_9BACT|nr:MAG: hypothetical protein UU32_C0004G0008 [Candidatus Woesebacteria bacterium GW2011_GWB1_41_10]
MNFQQIRQVLKKHNLEVFTTQEFVLVTGIDRKITTVKLARYKKAGYLISPKKGVYYLSGEEIDKYRIANKTYYPSYISLDSALAKYNIIPESVYSITSVTTKATREFNDSQTIYKYYKIKRGAYLGYQKENEALVAEKEKALVDYLYFASQGKRDLNDRVDLSSLDKNKIIYYAKFFGNKRLDNLIKKIC